MSENFIIKDGVLVGCEGFGSELVIPEGVTAIGDNVFMYNTELCRVQFPSTLERIGEDAFVGCSALERIALPRGLKVIERYAFRRCEALEEIVFSGCLEELGNEAFLGCKSLTALRLPAPMPEKQTRCQFQDCTNLVSVTAPEYVDNFPGWLFADCPNIRELTLLTDRKVSLHPGAFHEKQLPQTLYTPRLGPSQLGDAAVKRAAAMTFVRKRRTPEDYTPEAAADYLKYIRSQRKFFLPLALEEDGLLELLLEERMLKNEDAARLLELAQAQNRTEISARVLDYQQKNCTPEDPFRAMDKAVKQAEQEAQEEAHALETGDLSPRLAKASWRWETGEAGLCLTAYKGTEPDLTVPLAIGGDQVRALGAYALSPQQPKVLKTMKEFRFKKLRSLVLPPNLTEIPEGLCMWCSKLRKVILPQGLTKIGARAFCFCPIRTLSLPETVTQLGELVFSCTALTKVTLPAGLTALPDRCFEECDSLKSVTLPEGMEEIGENAFFRCKNLKQIVLPRQLKYIGKQAFHNTGLKEIHIPEGTQGIGEEAFSYCADLARVHIPASVTYIHAKAFSGGFRKTVIYGAEGSYAQKFAKSHRIAFSAVQNQP